MLNNSHRIAIETNRRARKGEGQNSLYLDVEEEKTPLE